MENEFIEKEKLGGGIVTMSIILICINVINFFSNLNGYSTIDKQNAIISSNPLLADSGMKITSTQITIALIIAIITIISAILILLRKKIGVIAYFATVLCNLFTIIVFSSSLIWVTLLSIVVSLIIPILMLIFVLRKKAIFFKTKNDNTIAQ